MAGGYTVGIASETKAFKQGIEAGVIDPLEDAQKELDELGRNRGPDELERGFTEAARASEKLSGEVKQTANAIEREFRDAYREAKNASDDGMGRMKDGAREVTSEIGGNLGEAVSSIRGDFSDLGQVGQDTLGGLAATLANGGPAGIAGAAALAAGAVGLGLVTAELERQQEEADALRERLSGAFAAASAEGRSYIDTAQLVSEANSVMFDTDRADEWKRLQEDAKYLGLDTATVIAANGGQLEAQAEIEGRINAMMDDRKGKRSDLGGEMAQYGQELLGVKERWEGISAVTDENTEKAKYAQEVTDAYLKSAIREAGNASEEIDAFGNKLLTLPSGEQIVIDAITGMAHQNIDAFKGDLDGIPHTVTSTVAVKVDSSAWDNWVPGKKIGPVHTSNGQGGSGGTTWD